MGLFTRGGGMRQVWGRSRIILQLQHCCRCRASVGTQSKQALEDVNGDGLPDYIESIDPLKVRLNTGNGYERPFYGPAPGEDQ